ncbi:MAG: carbohydrate binding domain-containing protein, partial [Bacteroidota bacterium]
FDGIYFDAIDGSDILGGPENFWYYGSKFLFEVAKHLKRPVGMEMSSMVHHWWHYRSRWQAWDTPRRGFKRFVDIHSSSIKSGEYEHGYWRGDTSLINKLAPLENGGLLLPLQLGWWLNFTWNPPQTEPTFTDDIEYLCCKMVWNNAGLALLGGIEKKEIDENPSFRRLNTIIKQYEELRHKNYFNDTIRALLRKPGKEFTLFREDAGSWNFKPTAYQKHKVLGINHPSAHWFVNNEFDIQPVMLRIEPLLSVKSYTDKDNILLTDFSSPMNFLNKGTANGVSGEIISSTEKMISGDAGGIFSAISSGVSPRNGSWISMEKKFEPWLNLEKNQALGVWIKGDGNGEILNFRLETPEQFSAGVRGDHFVKIDFTGWKYFELVEIESAEFTNYIWPGSEISPESVMKDLFVYKSYLHSVQFDKVDKLQLWYNNLPAGKEVSCMVGPVKAIPTVYENIDNPSISIGGGKITFPVKMESGMYLEFRSSTDCKLYGSKGQLLMEIIPEGKIPNLVNGINEISFSCIGSDEINPRVQVTVINEGDPLLKK